MEKVRNLSMSLAIGLLALFVAPTLLVMVAADPPDPTPEPVLIPPVSWEGGEVSVCYAGCGGKTAPVVNADYEQQVVELTNAERAKEGLPPLKRVTQLDNAARYHATDMGQDDYFGHDTYDRVGGNLVFVCKWWARIGSYYPSPLAEIIAAGCSTPQGIMDLWMNSPGHKNIILNTYSWEIGAGYYAGSGSHFCYWVQDFGRRSGVYPLIINREAATTDSTSVSLYIYGSWDEIRLRNDDGSWTDWQPFQANMNWTLKSEAGERTVWAEMRTTGGQTATSSDTIYLLSPALGNLPDALHFTYSIPEQRLLATAHRVRPENVGNDETLTWSITSTGTWFTVSPLGSTTPNSFWVTPTAFITTTVMTYTGGVTVTATDPPDVEGSPHPIDLTLRVVASPFSSVHLPLMGKSYTP